MNRWSWPFLPPHVIDEAEKEVEQRQQRPQWTGEKEKNDRIKIEKEKKVHLSETESGHLYILKKKTTPTT